MKKKSSQPPEIPGWMVTRIKYNLWTKCKGCGDLPVDIYYRHSIDGRFEYRCKDCALKG